MYFNFFKFYISPRPVRAYVDLDLDLIVVVDVDCKLSTAEALTSFGCHVMGHVWRLLNSHYCID